MTPATDGAPCYRVPGCGLDDIDYCDEAAYDMLMEHQVDAARLGYSVLS